MSQTILLLAASPVDQTKLRLDLEEREIKEGLKRSKHRDQFQLQKQGALRTDDLRRVLLDTTPTPLIVHFFGEIRAVIQCLSSRRFINGDLK